MAHLGTHDQEQKGEKMKKKPYPIIIPAYLLLTVLVFIEVVREQFIWLLPAAWVFFCLYILEGMDYERKPRRRK